MKAFLTTWLVENVLHRILITEEVGVTLTEEFAKRIAQAYLSDFSQKPITCQEVSIHTLILFIKDLNKEWSDRLFQSECGQTNYQPKERNILL